MREALAPRTLELVDVASVSRDEADARRRSSASEVPLDARATGTMRRSLRATPRPAGRSSLLAGHLDTVPPQGNLPGRIEDGVVHGLGAARHEGRPGGDDRARPLGRRAEQAPLAVDLAFLFFPREELPARRRARSRAFLATGLADDAALVVVLEPTENAIQAGCLGHITATLVFEGRSGHSARPWLADNAIDRAVAGLARSSAARRATSRSRASSSARCCR